MGSPFQPQDPGANTPEPDYGQQSTFDALPQTEIAPQTYNDPSWEAPQPGGQPAAPEEDERPEDYGTVPAGQGGDLPSSAQAVVRRMTEAGYTPDHIAGVLGVLDQESPGFKTGAVGDNGTSFGIAQWHASRTAALMQFARNRNIDPYDADTQAQYIVHELNGPAYRAGQDLMAQKSFAGAAHVWRAEFEKPANNYDDAAIAAASRFLPSVQKYVAGLHSGDADRQDVQDGTINGTADGTGGTTGEGSTLDPLSRMMSLIGGNAATAAPFIKAGGGSLDPRKDNWCAAFANAALSQAGIRGSNSNVATSFMNWGQPVDANEIQRNDVVCIPRGHGPGELGGHVGIATGGVRNGPNGPEVEMVSGNTQHGHIAVGWYPENEVVIRRSATANTQAMDPQAGGPDVDPTMRRTTNATFTSNGLTFPDFNNGGTLPHGDGAPMDPSLAAQFRQTYAPNNLWEMARQFGGSLADMGHSIAMDAYGQGPISDAINGIGRYFGTDMSWLTKPIQVPGMPINTKAGVQSENERNDALDRSIGYNPNAPTGFLGEAGRYAGLIASMLGPGALGDAATAAKAGKFLGAAGKVLSAADKSAIGGMTLAEGQHTIQDLTGSQQVGELSMTGLAAILGLRVPVLEKMMPSVLGMAKGALKYGRGLVGEGLPDANVFENMTPSQLHEAFASGLRGDFNDAAQKAGLELATAGQPTSFPDQGNVNANLTQGSELFGKAIGAKYDAARAVEKGLWNNVDKDVPRDYAGANAAYQQELSNFQEEQRLYNRPDADFPSSFLHGIFNTASPQRLETTMVPDVYGNPMPWQRAVSANDTRGLGMTNNLGAGQNARRQIEERIRFLENNPDTPGARAQIGTLQRVSHALLDDMTDMTNGAGSDVSAFNKARAFSRSLAELRQQPAIAAVLDKGLANGRNAVDAATAADQFLASGPAGVAGLRQLQQLAKVNGGASGDLDSLFKDYVRQDFVKSAAPDLNHVNLNAANRYMQRYGQLLERMPDVRDQLNGVISGEQNVSQILGKGMKGWNADPAGIDARAAAARTYLDSPVDQVLDAFDGRSPSQQALMFKNVFGQVMRDKTGAAFQGYRNALVDKILKGAEQGGSQQAISNWAQQNQGLIQAMNQVDPTFAQRIGELSTVNNKVGVMSAATDLGQRMLGTHLGSLLNHVIPGGGMAGGLSAGSWGVKTIRQAWASLPFSNRLDIARNILANPDAYAAFKKMGGTSLKGVGQSLGQQYTAGQLLSSYLQRGATPAALALQHVMNDWRRKNGDPNVPAPGNVGWQPGPASQAEPSAPAAPVASPYAVPV